MTSLNPRSQQWLQMARQTLDIETQALQYAATRLGDGLIQAVDAMLRAKGRVVVMGMGKSGHVGTKIAATLASTGTPAFFVHPAEARHGDLGMIQSDDVVLAISNSGESEELTSILPFIKRMGVPLVAMTGVLNSTLAAHDPGGSLGRRLLTHVHDLMRSGDALPCVQANDSLMHVMQVMSEKGLGAAIGIDDKRHVWGIFTDGDLRRLLAQGLDVRALTASQVMKNQPRTILPGMLAVEAAQAMEQHRITTMVVVNEQGVLQGALNMHDLMRAKVI